MRILMTMVLVACIHVPALAQEIDAELLVQHFSLQGGLSVQLTAPGIDEILELVEAQRQEIDSVIQEMEKRVEPIKQNMELSAAEKLEALKNVRSDLNNRMREILIPHQVRALELLPIRLVISSEGLACSLTKGLIAEHIQLSVAEQERLEKAAQATFELYEKEVMAAQKKALKELRESLPKNKRDEYDQLVGPLLFSSGTLWRPDSKWLDPNRELPARSLANRMRIPLKSKK